MTQTGSYSHADRLVADPVEHNEGAGVAVMLLANLMKASMQRLAFILHEEEALGKRHHQCGQEMLRMQA